MTTPMYGELKEDGKIHISKNNFFCYNPISKTNLFSCHKEAKMSGLIKRFGLLLALIIVSFGGGRKSRGERADKKGDRNAPKKDSGPQQTEKKK